jgi:hypothetical protein
MDILNIELEEKTDEVVRIVYRDETTNLPVDITGYSAELQLRYNFGDQVNLIDQLTTAAGTIVLGGQTGAIDLIFKPTDTDQSSAQLAWSRAAYDLVLIDPAGKRKKLVKGFITIARSASF